MLPSSLLKLYCGYILVYTGHCMINRTWGLKQLWLHENGHTWFHLQGHRWAIRLRPLGHDALMTIGGLMSYRIMGYKFIKPLRDNTCQIDYGYMCIWTDCQTKSTFLISMKILASIISVYRTSHGLSNHNLFHTHIIVCPFVFIVSGYC